MGPKTGPIWIINDEEVQGVASVFSTGKLDLVKKDFSLQRFLDEV